MRRTIPILAVLLAIIIQTRSTAAADTGSSPDILCMPGIYLQAPQDCLPLGPSTYLTDMAQQGISLPLKALPGSQADSNLAIIPNLYARLKDNVDVPIYASLEDAIAQAAPVSYIEAGKLRYVSYVDQAFVNGGEKPDYFMLKSGGWISASSVARRENGIMRFQGMEFTRTPTNSFGWILPFNPYVETKRTPGFEQDDYTGHQIIEYGLVQIYAEKMVGDQLWYLIAPDEWVEQRLVGRVIPNPTPPQGVTNGRWIEVNLFEQTLSVYEHGQLVFATLIATGMEPFYTRPGLFQIYEKFENAPMRGAFEADRSDFYYLEDVPWTMYYDKARALHGAYWRTRFGFPQSHGCVNLSPGDSHWLFDWAQVGDWVYVWDPSGKTPTDPALYGDGGA